MQTRSARAETGPATGCGAPSGLAGCRRQIRCELVRRVAVPLALVAAVVSGPGPSSAAEAPRLRVVKTYELPRPLRWAWDVRWATDGSVLLAAGRQGVVELTLDTGAVTPALPASGALNFLAANQIGRSRRYVAAGGIFFAVAWKPADRPASQKDVFAISAVSDIDVRGDQLLVLGAQMEDDGQWCADGALAWLGSLDRGFADAHPVLFSTAGPGAANAGRCAAFELGKARFLPGGGFVVVPGVDRGVYLYGRDGTLQKTWQTETLGIDSGCTISKAQERLLARDPRARWAWLDARRLVDEILPLPSGPALVVRSVRDGVTSWEIEALADDGTARSSPVPVTSPSGWSHLRGDVRGDRVVLLRLESGTMEEAPAAPPQLIVAEIVR